MSATGGKITLRFEVDIAQLEQKIAKVQQNLDKVQTSGDKVSQSLEKTSQASVTSAVRFQTLSQGAINLTTSFAQTYTSLSNIQRAQTTVAAATVSLERAEDLLQRKQVQLNDERRKALPNMDKIRLLTNEISTAERDLGVKRQKLTDATNQANDTNILFGINLLNVSFAALQTGKSMIDMAKASTVASVGVSGVSKAVKGLRTALTFLQTHPVFLVVTAGILAWELGLSKLIKQVYGVDYSIQGLTESALGLDQMKDATEILGTEFENTGSQIDSMGGTMTSVSGNMISSLGNVQTSVSQLQGAFVNINSSLQDIAAATAGIGGTPSVLDYIKTMNSQISSTVSDLNIATKLGLDMESAKKLVLDDILQDQDAISIQLLRQYETGQLTYENLQLQLKVLHNVTAERKNALQTAEDQINAEERLGQAIDNNQKKTKDFFNLGSRRDFRTLLRDNFFFDDIPFAGTVNSRTYQIVGSLQHLALLKSIDYIENNIQAEISAGADPLAVAQKYEPLIKEIGKQPGIVSSNPFIARWSRSYTTAIDKLQDYYRRSGVLPTFGERARYSTSYTLGMQAITRTAGERARATAESTIVNATTIMSRVRGVNISTYGSSRLLGPTVNGLTTSGLSGKRGRGPYLARERRLDRAIDAITGGFGNVQYLEALTGLDLTSFDRGYVSWRGGGMIDFERRAKSLEALKVRMQNANMIKTLIIDYGLSSYYKSPLSNSELAFRLQEQDNMMQGIGLSRTQAFEIIANDTRGRAEIDDRLRWNQRLEQISTGATVF